MINLGTNIIKLGHTKTELAAADGGDKPPKMSKEPRRWCGGGGGRTRGRSSSRAVARALVQAAKSRCAVLPWTATHALWLPVRCRWSFPGNRVWLGGMLLFTVGNMLKCAGGWGGWLLLPCCCRGVLLVLSTCRLCQRA